MAEIRFDEVSCVYKGAARPAVSNLDLTAADGEFLVLVGPSGCGKTTSLRMLAGLEHPSGGAILMGGRDVTRLSPSARDVAMVFQSYALYPNMTVLKNIEFPLKVAGLGKGQRRERALRAAAMLDLSELIDRKPKALSGGQRQRVAMGRAIVRRPQAFLLDEPLSNLDAKLRVETRTQIAALQRELGVTTLYVTHDQVEAMTMGDRVAVMRDGELQQCGTPAEIYRQPVNTFVAGFIGSPPMNLLPAPLSAAGATLGSFELPLERSWLAGLNGDRELVIGIRPDGFRLASDGGIPVIIGVVEILGSEAYAYGKFNASGIDTQLVVRVDPLHPPARGEMVHAIPVREGIYVFSAATDLRISQ